MSLNKDRKMEDVFKAKRAEKIAQAKEGRNAQRAYAEALDKTLGHLITSEQLEEMKKNLDPHNLRTMTDKQIEDEYYKEYPDSLIEDYEKENAKVIEELKQKVEKITEQESSN